MYLHFHGLQREPFSIAPDPHFLYLSEAHREALAHLLYGVAGGGGFVLLTGEIGAGKTTVCRGFLEQAPSHHNVAYVFNPQLTVSELLQTVCDEFGVAVEAGPAATVKDFIDALNHFLLAAHAAGRHSVLIIDEAQALSAAVLEQLRLLTNLETAEHKLLQVILIGQPELRQMVARPELEQLAQRIIARYHLPALSETDTARYVRHRLAVAGLQGEVPFDDAALKRLHRHGRGVPRRINVLADRALLGAYAQGRRRVDRQTVDQAAEEVFGARPGSLATPGPRRTAMVMAAWLLVLGGAGMAWWWGKPQLVAKLAPVARPAQAASPAAGPPPSTLGGVATASAKPAPAMNAVLPTPVADTTLVLAGAFRSEAAAWRALATVWGASLPAQGDPCEAAARQQLQCWRGNGGLAQLRTLNRPVLLALNTSAAASSGRVHALLLGLGGQHALLLLDGQAQRVPLSLLAGLWRGEQASYWRSPPGLGPTPADAASPAFTTWLDKRLPGTAKAPLNGRVAAFQVTQGLTPDGLPGPMTLMLLNQVSGVDEPRLQRAD